MIVCPTTGRRPRKQTAAFWPPLALLAGLVLVGSQPAATVAQGSQHALAPGPWWAAGSAIGRAVVSERGLEMVWQGRVPAQFAIDVHSDGSATGTWEHQGEAVMTFDVSRAGASGEARAEHAYTGSGSVSGSNERLVLNGSSRTVGQFTISGQGQTLRFPIDNTSAIPTLYLNVVATSCDEAYGDWAYTVESAFEDQGFSATIDGWWVGIRESEEVKNQAEELYRLSTETGSGAPPVSSESPLLDTAANVIRRYNELADGLREATLDEVFDVLADADAVLNTLRNLSDCDVELLGGENVESYLNGMNFIIQGLIIGGLDVFEVTSADWQLMVQIAARTGAIGAGAIDPAAAAQAELALIDEGSAILEEHYLPETDTFEQTEDSVRVLATGAAMGWTYEVAGLPVNARGTYRDAFGPAPEEP